MKETSKAMLRRANETEIPWDEIFQGRGLDVGAGDDPLILADCQPFDQGDGDANRLSEYFPKDHFDYLHASQCLEHMADPRAAIREWLKVVKPGGYLIATVPDVGSYERFQFPSVYNPDHKSSWSMVYKGSPFPIHIQIPSFLDELSSVAEVVVARYVERNYDWNIGKSRDQTLPVGDMVEIWNEFVLRKL